MISDRDAGKRFSFENLSPVIRDFCSRDCDGELFIEKGGEGELFYRIERPGEPLFEERKRTVTHLKEAFGEERIVEIFEREGQQSAAELFRCDQLPLDRERVELLSLGIAYYRDERPAPFEEPRLDPFFGERPELGPYGAADSCGKGIRGLRERLALIQELAAIEAPREEQVVEYLSSKLADREPPVGTVIALGEKSYRYERNLTANGAFISLLRDREERASLLITCRGTAGGAQATGYGQSVMNNLLREPGSYALQGNWRAIAEYLEGEGIKRVDIYGKSQGGAIAQYMAPLIEKYSSASIENLYTYASIGISDEAREIFLNIFGERERPMKIHAYYNVGLLEEGDHDTIPTCCGRHVEVNTEFVSTKFFALTKGNFDAMRERTNPQGFTSIHYFFESFKGPHNRHTTNLDGYKVTEIQVAETDPLLDNIRKGFADFLEFFSPLPSYRSFFNSLEAGGG